MSDAFDQWVGWRYKSPDDRSGLPADIYSAVMSLPQEERRDRQKVNQAVRMQEQLRREGRTVWVYFNTAAFPGDPDWLKLFASAEAADHWLGELDPEGVAWEYEVEGGPRRGSVWVYLEPNEPGIARPERIKLFATRDEADRYLQQNNPSAQLSEYFIQE